MHKEELAGASGTPQTACDVLTRRFSVHFPQDMKIDPKNGIPYELDHIGFRLEDSLPYALATHSGPWHLREAIQSSNHVSADMETADVIYVYDHCYYMMWLAQVRRSISGTFDFASAHLHIPLAT